jgi:two-component system response regulator RegX3
MHIGILEDDRAQQEIYKLCFSVAQHDSDCHETVAAFMDALKSTRFDLLIIDWMLPDGTGEEVLTWVRENLGWDLPIIFVTARDAEADIVSALRKGADDYVVKPPKIMELLARIETLSRRSKTSPPRVLRLGSYEINQDLRTIYVSGKPVELTQKEFELAAYLFQHPGKLLSRVHLLEQLWGLNADVDTRTVDTHISRIRRKLGINPEHGWQIISVHGYGYRIERSEPGSSQAG